MPAGQQNGFDAQRFAALMARFDTGNPSEVEAINAVRILRRMVAGNGLRVVDVLERPDVKRALDDQMQPVRTESGELQAALEQAASLREELTQRTRDVRKLAVLLKQQKQTTECVRKELGAAIRTAREAQPGFGATYPPALSPAASIGIVNGCLVAVMALAVLALLIAATLSCRR